MLKITRLSGLILLFAISTILQAQIIDPKEEASKQGTKRANNKIEEGVDKGFDKLEEGIGSLFGKKKKKNKKGSSNEDKNAHDENAGSNRSTPTNDNTSASSLPNQGIYPADGAKGVSFPITFKWDPIDHDGFVATGHEFYLNEAGQHENIMVGGPRGNEFTYKDLKPNTTYWWKVVGSSSSGYMPGPGGTFTTGTEVSVASKMDVAWSKFDFVPGDEVIFADAPDIMEENGEFPSRWDLVKGQVEIATINGENAIMFLSGAASIVPYLENSTEDYLPEVFTIEFDMYTPKGGNRFQLYLSDRKNQTRSKSQEFDITPVRVDSPDGISVQHASRDYTYYANNGVWTRVSLAYTNGKLKVYLDDTRLINIPHYPFNPSGITIQAYFASMNDDKPFYLKNIRIAKGGVKYYDRVMSDGKIICNGIRFDVNKATLKAESMGPINKIHQLMQKKPDLKFSVEGHTDSDGDEAINQSLSEQRAKVVMNQLISMGISPSRLKSTGFGETKALDVNSTPEGKANNRRVEFVKF